MSAPLIEHKNRIVRAHLKPLVQNAQETTHLTADISAASGTLTVQNIGDFAVNQILVLGEIGSEDTEIVKTHGSTAPSGSTITLAANTTFAHPRGTMVYRVEFDQIEISHAATLTGSKSVLQAAENLQVDSFIHEYLDTSETSGFYFARFKETIGNTFSVYSDGVPYSGWATSQLGFAVDYALRRNNTQFGGVVDENFMIDEANACISISQGKLKRWPQHQKFDEIVGQTARGTNKITLPTDIYDTNSNKSILNVRIGDNDAMTYVDPIEYEDRIEDVKSTQVRTEASATDTSLALDNSYDFDDSGSVNVYISGTKHNITYTGVTRDDASGGTAVLTGIPASGTGAITVTIPVDTYVWQDEEEGLPSVYTIRNGSIEYYDLPSATYDNLNVYMDYWTVADSVDSLGDTLDITRADMIKHWLTWKVRMQKKNEGKLDFNDGDYALYKEILNDVIRTMVKSVKHRSGPRINKIKY